MAVFTKRASPCIVGFEGNEGSFGLEPAILQLTWMPSLNYVCVLADIAGFLCAPGVFGPIIDQTTTLVKQLVAEMRWIQALWNQQSSKY